MVGGGAVAEVRPPRGPASDFRRGLLTGLLVAAMLAVLPAAARRTQNPVLLIDAIVATGVPIDARLARVAPEVRRQLLCVALAVLMEARGEPNAGQVGVAWVVRTRSAERGLLPCDVVMEPAQFSWTAYPFKRIVTTAAANGETLLEAQDWAWRVMVEGVADPTGGANHFYGHRAIKAPAWAGRGATGRVVIGGHTFLRRPG